MNNRSRWKFGRLLRACLGMAFLTTGALALQHWQPILPIERLRELEKESDKVLLGITDGPVSDFDYVFSRLEYRGPGGRLFEGHTWDTDYPKADRQFLIGVLRYTGVNGRRQEQVLRLDDPDLFRFPFLYAVEVGYLDLSEENAVRLREYLERGGFLVVDDFHGSQEWQRFEREMKKVFPNRKIVDVEQSDPIFHCFFNIEEKKPVPGLQYLITGRIFEQDGTEEHYRAIYDDNGRIMVMINFNVDLGDAWEWSDLPQYPEEWTSYAYRLGVNYIVYSMTH